MTDPTREAFEAWWNDCDIPWAEEPEHFAWAAWQAALSARAPQGREEGEAWQEGYRQGVLDERTSEANIGIAGFGAKVEPARNNPYALAALPGKTEVVTTSAEALMALTEKLTEHPEGWEGPCWCATCRSYATDDDALPGEAQS